MSTNPCMNKDCQQARHDLTRTTRALAESRREVEMQKVEIDSLREKLVGYLAILESRFGMPTDQEILASVEAEQKAVAEVNQRLMAKYANPTDPKPRKRKERANAH